MKNRMFIYLFSLVAAVALLVGAFAQSTSTPPPNYQLLTTISVPGGLAGYDISWVDPGTESAARMS